MRSTITIILTLCLLGLQAHYDYEDEANKRCFVGSIFTMLGNLLPDERQNYVQLYLRYRITEQDVVSVEAKTWRYFKPLGIPYDEACKNPEEYFPGLIRKKGFALAYQSFFNKGLYATVHLMSAWYDFIYTNEVKFDNGFQNFNTYRLGYPIKLSKRTFFMERSIAITYRRHLMEMSEAFKRQDGKWSKSLFAGPGLHFGYNL
ncbi:hypothetical protein BFP77_03845 [Maribacter sp. 4U21]|uniref:hypothetical protein n=1 Tax=Maribacter sp. 4U21 TaxID=1889779 RepID=UPI000C162171|nr:hypothetical protein [Maribacter sp. 4U21]PIB30702.1 hypothetical protein BFP77_03845 [Maribacter sp. 4U21]